MGHRNVRDVGRPDLIGASDFDAAEQGREKATALTRSAQTRVPVDRLDAHQGHQTAHTFDVDDVTLPSRDAHVPSEAIVREDGEICRRRKVALVSGNYFIR